MDIFSLFSQVFNSLRDMFNGVYIYGNLTAWQAFIGLIAVSVVVSAVRMLFSYRSSKDGD